MVARGGVINIMGNDQENLLIIKIFQKEKVIFLYNQLLHFRHMKLIYRRNTRQQYQQNGFDPDMQLRCKLVHF